MLGGVHGRGREHVGAAERDLTGEAGEALVLGREILAEDDERVGHCEPGHRVEHGDVEGAEERAAAETAVEGIGAVVVLERIFEVGGGAVFAAHPCHVGGAERAGGSATGQHRLAHDRHVGAGLPLEEDLVALREAGALAGHGDEGAARDDAARGLDVEGVVGVAVLEGRFEIADHDRHVGRTRLAGGEHDRETVLVDEVRVGELHHAATHRHDGVVGQPGAADDRGVAADEGAVVRCDAREHEPVGADTAVGKRGATRVALHRGSLRDGWRREGRDLFAAEQCDHHEPRRVARPPRPAVCLGSIHRPHRLPFVPVPTARPS